MGDIKVKARFRFGSGPFSVTELAEETRGMEKFIDVKRTTNVKNRDSGQGPVK